ncbi:MAG: FAD:protein FMN transferase [Methylobacteriaceae bacterium]|jgi:thiamine biosynthesis lipoprotein ApbE|nr:FAD:protein FMN transferase [Methylobacteriaceae bacterium]
MSEPLSRRRFVGLFTAGTALILAAPLAAATSMQTLSLPMLGTTLALTLFDGGIADTARLKTAAAGISTRLLSLADREDREIAREAARLTALTDGLFSPAAAPVRGASRFPSYGGFLQGRAIDETAALLHTLGIHRYRMELGGVVTTSDPRPVSVGRVGIASGVVHPVSGAPAKRYTLVEAEARTATEADAFATAFALMDSAHITRTLSRAGGGRVRLAHADGRTQEMTVS